jgi:hypothetical protein
MHTNCHRVCKVQLKIMFHNLSIINMLLQCHLQITQRRNVLQGQGPRRSGSCMPMFRPFLWLVQNKGQTCWVYGYFFINDIDMTVTVYNIASIILCKVVNILSHLTWAVLLWAKTRGHQIYLHQDGDRLKGIPLPVETNSNMIRTMAAYEYLRFMFV